MNAAAEAPRPPGPELAGAVAVACRILGDAARPGMAIGPLTTYRVGGAAAVGIVAGGVEDLVAVGRAAAASGLGVLVVGRGSNLLVHDAGFAGIAVVLDAEGFGDIAVHRTFSPAEESGAVPVHVDAGAMVSLPVLARRTAAAGLSGFEWAVGVPGSVGGAVRMNAGGHGSDMAETLVAATVVDLRDGSVSRRPTASLGLGFRRSGLGEHEVVVAARLALWAADRGEAEARIAEIVAWRRANQPGGQNAGSVFVNPRPEAAGKLIDDCGLRGLRIGTAEVSTKHANFIQADEGGRAADVVAVMRAVRERVRVECGVQLRSEIRLVGFPPEDPPFDVGIGYALDEAEERR